MPLRRASALVSVLLTSAVPLAASDAWTSLGPAGGCVGLPVVHPHDSSTIYTIDNSGVVKSVDGGFTWRRTDSPPLAVLKIHPAHPEVLVGIETRNSITTSTPVLDLIVWRSEDGGRSWVQKGVTRQFDESRFYKPNLVLDPTSTATAFIAGCSGVSKTIDGGATWQVLDYAWTRCDAPIGVDPLSPPVIYTLAYTDHMWLYKSTVDGSVRAVLPYPFICLDYMIGFVYPITLVVDPVAHGTLYTLSECGLAKSTEGGFNWRYLASGASDWGHTFLAMAPSDHNTLFRYSPATGSQNGAILRSTDGGESWNISGTVPESPCGPEYFVVDPADPAVLWTPRTDGGMWRSSDVGLSWEARGGGLHGSGVGAAALVADPGDPERLYAVVGGMGLVRTDDRGASWVRVGSGLPASQISQLAIVPVVPPMMFASTPSGVYASDDEGVSWRFFLDAESLFVDLVQPTTLYAGARNAGSEGLLRSTDGGKSWQNILDVGRLGTFAIDAADHNTLIAYIGDVLCLSHDGGRTWSPGLPIAGDIAYIATDPHAPGVYLAMTNWPRTMIRSTDGGTSWGVVKGFPDVAGGLFPIPDIVFDPCAPGVVFANTNVGVVKSEDHGLTWCGFNAGLNYAVVAKFAFSSDSRTLYAGTQSNGVFSVDPGPRVCQFRRVRRHL